MSNAAIAWAKGQKTGSGSRKIVLLVLADYADQTGQAFPSVRQLCVDTDLSERAVRKALSELAELGLLGRQHRVRTDQSNTSNLFVLNMQGVGARRAPLGAPDAPPPLHDVHPLLHEVQGDGARGAPLEPLLEPSLSFSVARATKRAEAQQAQAPKPDLDEPFHRFWAAYPKREGPNPKKPARAEFAAAVRRGSDPEAILAGAVRFAAHWAKRSGSELRFVPHARKWLRDEAWQDDDDAAMPEPKLVASDETWRRRHERWRRTGSWASSWGPDPDDPMTKFPAHLRRANDPSPLEAV
ncbi:helix-turn-helix domain-containing protein [Alsobacter sp. SYSU BS001988]